jgi:hypothetical protein
MFNMRPVPLLSLALVPRSFSLLILSTRAMDFILRALFFLVAFLAIIHAQDVIVPPLVIAPSGEWYFSLGVGEAMRRVSY